MKIKFLSVILLLLSLKVQCRTSSSRKSLQFELSSTSFKNGGTIPQKYAFKYLNYCPGLNQSPELSWQNAPKGTKSFALIMEDPSVVTYGIRKEPFVQWFVYNIPANTLGLREGLPNSHYSQTYNDYSSQDYKFEGYGGPCPPPNQNHKYVFNLYALNVDNLKESAPLISKDFEKTYSRHILGKAKLTGYFIQK